MNRHERRKLRAINPGAYIEHLEKEIKALRAVTTPVVEGLIVPSGATIQDREEAAFVQGFEHAIEVVSQYYEPLYNTVKAIEHVVGIVNGAVASHPHSFPHKLAEKLATDLGQLLNEADIQNQTIKVKFGGSVDFTFVQEIRSALVSIVTAGDETRLRELVRSDEAVAPLVDLLETIKSRKPRKAESDTIRVARAMKTQIAKGCSIREAAAAVKDNLSLNLEESTIINHYYRHKDKV